MAVDRLVTEGREALRVGDAAAARRAFEAAAAEEQSGEVLDGLSRAAYLAFEFRKAIDTMERAYAAFRQEDDHVGAVRAARTLAYMNGMLLGDYAVMSGWLARAQTMLGNAPDSAEAGWVALNIGMFEGDRAGKNDHFRKALGIARDTGDTDLEFVTLAYLGASLVHGDHVEEGMMLLDEALAAIAGSDVVDFTVLEEIFCQLFSACEHAHDVARADQWIRIGNSIAERRNLPSVAAFCRTHYGGLLTTAGRWPEADEALTEAVRVWGLGFRALRAGALVRLADLRVRQGRFEEAEQLLEGLEDDGDAARSRAAIRLARGETSLARDILERALSSVEPTSAAAAPFWSLLVDVHLAAGEVDDAGAAAEALAQCASGTTSHYLRAAAALAHGRVCLARGSGDPNACLREALAGFSKAQMPMELARSRLELANALVADNPEVAMAEARAALEAFERLQAAREADAASALLRSLGARGASVKRTGGVLSKREAEVLDLLGHGLSNPEISDRLYISRKTVEHHVGSILAKLGLRSRSEAAVYALRAKSVSE